MSAYCCGHELEARASPLLANARTSGYGFGGIFEMNPQKTYLSDAEYATVIEKIKAGL